MIINDENSNRDLKQEARYELPASLTTTSTRTISFGRWAVGVHDKWDNPYSSTDKTSSPRITSKIRQIPYSMIVYMIELVPFSVFDIAITWVYIQYMYVSVNKYMYLQDKIHVKQYMY